MYILSQMFITIFGEMEHIFFSRVGVSLFKKKDKKIMPPRTEVAGYSTFGLVDTFVTAHDNL